jgi:ribonuclease P/MRP protein subunit RPP1
MPFYDLNVSMGNGEKTSRLEAIAKRLVELKYLKACVCTESFGKVPKCRNEELDEEIRKRNETKTVIKDVRIGKQSPTLLSRITITGENLSHFQGISIKNPILGSYDVVAGSPQTQQTFKFLCCECAAIDIITIDSEQRLPYVLNRSDIDTAIKRGIHFEITYSGAVRDASQRRYFVSNAMTLVRATRGRNIIISSGADSDHVLRSPHDALNLGVLAGLTFEQARACLSTNCENVLEHAKSRSFHKGFVRVESTKDLDEESESWMKTDQISSLLSSEKNESSAKDFIRL